MKFVDQATIFVKSGDGGPGCVSFRREKYVPRGGPDGGDGGRGGHVIIAASSQKDTLYRFHLNQHFRAEKGQGGQGKNKHGKNGTDLTIHLPLGTSVFDADSGVFLTDLTKSDQIFIVAEGGLGGRGNARFATATNRAPRYAQPGTSGLELRLRLELKLLADVGLVGLPNVGKSTVISRLSAARPKIADYPFTTLIPNLGVVAVDAEHSFVMADIPGLIEGASQGAGLGHRFLRHVQRCRLLVHILDANRIDPDFPLREFNQINNELAAFDQSLTEKKQIVAVNKMDLTGSEESLTLIRNSLPDHEIFPISAATGLGLDKLKWKIFELLQEDQPESILWEDEDQ